MHELPNDLRVRLLRNLEIPGKFLKCLELMASTQPTTQKANFDICAKNCEKSAVKQSIVKHILLASWICLQSFAQDCSVFIVNFKHILHVFLVFLLLTRNT